MHQNMFILNMFVRHMHNNGGRCRETEKLIRYVMAHRIPKQIEHLECLIELNDVDCIDNLRMSRVVFARLCYLLEHIGGLVNSRYVTVTEKGCIGALDGTYIKVKVNESDKPRYRTRKGDIAVNVLVACDMDQKFTYLLSGWEGSTADSRVLRDALNRANRLKVPQRTYYLCDNGYANGDGFLTPFKGVRYHLKDWGEGSLTPQNPHEYFNMYHSKALNVIERTIGLLKKRWAVLRSQTFYSITTQNRIIMTCALLHNFIRSEMLVHPLEHCLDDTNSDDEDNDIDL
ncbi:hypothetical protein BUALT_Bualt08G0065600 [Buddleja alternifolia]|uniref:DDE Tnp4 domain-containing protein n=1 Tax=Buddleja alternifolia TaxID=168488 RepID=A0AAV6X4N6_9LAMI|nr:hypothetical protein BUALT_Bualt08G0065600 [Buddleja alternifolia]